MKNTTIQLWPYGYYNAIVYISNVLDFNSNSELLLGCEDFLNDLDLHMFIFRIDNLPEMDDKIDKFYDLQISKWSMKETFASAFLCVLKKKRSEYLSVTNQVEKNIPFLCNDIYSETILDLYILFKFPNLYPDDCVQGCLNFFLKNSWSTQTKAYLNYCGLKNLLNLVGIPSKSLIEIIDLCNFIEKSSPFILFLEKYKKKTMIVFFTKVVMTC